MKTYLKALRKCRVHTKLNDTWLRPVVWMYKLKLKIPARWYSYWMIECYDWHEATEKDMLSQSRLFLAYDGALECPGRDTDEFMQGVIDRMGESMEFFMGRVSPRVEMSIAFDDPDTYPYQYVKWTTRITIYNVITYINKHYTWISLSVLLVLLHILTLLTF